MKLATVLLSLSVVIHHIIAYQHGAQHTILAIEMAAWQTGFINGVILILPLIGLLLLWTPWRQIGAYAILIGMLGALLFGIVHHYLLMSPDHISQLPAAEPHVHATFIWTAAAIAMLEGVAGMLAAYVAAGSLPTRGAPSHAV